MTRKEKRNNLLLYLLIMVTAACVFPIYQFTGTYRYPMVSVNQLLMNIACYGVLGSLEGKHLKNRSLPVVILLNLGMVLMSMLLRYFLEFGEITNLYNFTGINILVHILAVLAISSLSFLAARRSEA